MHASLRFFWVFSYSISHPFYSMDVLGQQVDAFIASPGCLKDIAPFVASEELSQSFFARYNLYAPPMAVQAAGGAGAIARPHCHGKDADGMFVPQEPCPGPHGCHGPMTIEDRTKPGGRANYRYKCNRKVGQGRCGITRSSVQIITGSSRIPRQRTGLRQLVAPRS